MKPNFEKVKKTSAQWLSERPEIVRRKIEKRRQEYIRKNRKFLLFEKIIQ